MVHGQCRHAQRHGQPRGEARAGKQCAGQPRPGGVGNGIDVGLGAAGLGQHLLQQGGKPADVIARSQLGNDAAVILVHRHLRMHRMGEQTARAVVQGEAGFVAGRFNAQYQHCGKFYFDKHP